MPALKNRKKKHKQKQKTQLRGIPNTFAHAVRNKYSCHLGTFYDIFSGIHHGIFLGKHQTEIRAFIKINEIVIKSRK